MVITSSSTGTTVSRLYELSYRCNLCRRCAQACPVGVDNALIAREIRKLFRQELGWAPQRAPRERHGAPAGNGLADRHETLSWSGTTSSFLDEDFSEATGTKITTPWDKEGADVLIIHSAGDIISFPESVVAFGILCNAAGIDWTLSSEAPGYDGGQLRPVL